MKGASSVIGIVALVAVAVLYVLHFTGNTQPEKNSPAETKKESEKTGLKIAYVKADSVIMNYDLAQDLHDEFTKKQEAYNAEYGNKRQ